MPIFDEANAAAPPQLTLFPKPRHDHTRTEAARDADREELATIRCATELERLDPDAAERVLRRLQQRFG